MYLTQVCMLSNLMADRDHAICHLIETHSITKWYGMSHPDGNYNIAELITCCVLPEARRG